jgi:ribosomal protein S6
MSKTTQYEVLAILRGTAKPSDTKKELEKLEHEISAIGKIEHKVIWENRPLAYKIKGELTGNYFLCVFSGDPAKIPEFDNHLRLDTAIIRYMIMATPAGYVWRDYTAEDLEQDYTKVTKVFATDAAGALTKKPEIKKLPTAPIKPVIKKKIEKVADSKEDVNKKLDNILGELSK